MTKIPLAPSLATSSFGLLSRIASAICVHPSSLASHPSSLIPTASESPRRGCSPTNAAFAVMNFTLCREFPGATPPLKSHHWGQSLESPLKIINRSLSMGSYPMEVSCLNNKPSYASPYCQMLRRERKLPFSSVGSSFIGGTALKSIIRPRPGPTGGGDSFAGLRQKNAADVAKLSRLKSFAE